MRTTRRTVILIGCIGFIALYILQYRLALAVTPLILLVGVLTGLAIAKWLPWAWYGRQFAAGVRAGAFACGLAAAGVILSLVGTGPHNVTALATRSQLPGISLANVVRSLGSTGWFTPYVLLTIFFAIGGVLVAGLVAQFAGWSKSVHTVRAIRQAHNAAASLHRSQTWAPASNSVPSVGGYWNTAIPSSGPASHPGILAAGVVVSTGNPVATHAPMSGAAFARTRGAQNAVPQQNHTYLSPLPPLEFNESLPLAPLPAAPEAIPPRRTNSGAQPVQFAMTDELRNALDRWEGIPEIEDDSGEHAEPAEPKKTAASKDPAASKPKTPAKRQPKASAYLNSSPPATPRRSRKKQNTRDWLC